MRTRREGTTIYYSLDSEIAQDVLALLQKHFCPPEAMARGSSGKKLETSGVD